MRSFKIGAGGTVRVEGIDRTKGKLEKLAKENKQKLRDGMWTAGRFLLRESQKLVPVDTGALKASGKVLVRNNSDDAPEYIVTYGNGEVSYAVYQHENLDYFHETGQAKFLEQPAREYRKTMIDMVERRFK